MSACQLNISLDASLKKQAESIYSSIGLSLADAVRMFIRQSVLERGLPLKTKLVESERPQFPEYRLSERAKAVLFQLLDDGQVQEEAEDKIAKLQDKCRHLDIHSVE